METVNMHQAKTHLSRLIAKAAKGEPFIIAKAGKPMVKVVPIEPPRTVMRTGFLAHVPMTIPDDFDRWAEDEIAEMFEGQSSKLLLDTHVLIWNASQPSRLSRECFRLINDPANKLFFSAVSIWEIAIKQRLQRPGFDIPSRELFLALVENEFGELALTSAHATAVESLPLLHGDPFDRLLIAQAVVEGCRLLTSDTRLARYGDRCCWSDECSARCRKAVIQAAYIPPLPAKAAGRDGAPKLDGYVGISDVPHRRCLDGLGIGAHRIPLMRGRESSPAGSGP